MHLFLPCPSQFGLEAGTRQARFRSAIMTEGSGKKAMSAGRKQSGKDPAKPKKGKEGEAPDWAEGLKRMYDSVVDEPLPDSFMELLSRLDEDRK